MKRRGEGDHCERLEQALLSRMHCGVKPYWEKALKSKIVFPLPFEHAASRRYYKSLAQQSISTRTHTLSKLNCLTEAAERAGKFDGDLRSILNPDILHDLFETELAYLSGLSKWHVCRMLWRLAWEFYRLSAPWLLVGGRRYRLSHVATVRKVDLYLPEKVLAKAEELSKLVRLDEPVSLVKAVLLRTVAHLCLMAIFKTRISEIGLMNLDQIQEREGGFVALLDPDHSKTRTGSYDPITGFPAQALKNYLVHGRPVLLGVRDGEAKDALWITIDGLKAEAGTVAGTMRRATRALMSGGVASGDLRRSAVSREGLTMVQQQRKLKHAFGSLTAPRTYRARDRNQAISQSWALSTLHGEGPSDLPPVQSCWSRRRRRTA